MTILSITGLDQVHRLVDSQPIKPENIFNSLIPNAWVFLAHILTSIVVIAVLVFLV